MHRGVRAKLNTIKLISARSLRPTDIPTYGRASGNGANQWL